jgi:hypothetical protein
MALDGKFDEKPDCAIFADTHFEPQAVYDHLAWLTAHCESVGFPIHIVSAGDIRADTLASLDGGGRFASMPFFVEKEDGEGAILRRQCTREYKVEPIQRQVRAMRMGREPVEMWLGISLDEYRRMKESRVKYIQHRYPLVDARLTRKDCILWLERNGYPTPPKSACIACPFHSNSAWREMKLTDPGSWSQAIAFDEATRVLPRTTGNTFLHSSLKPLSEVELGEDQLDLWANECEGHCGV